MEAVSKINETDSRKEGGLWLKRRRESLGLSQRDVANRLGLKFYGFVSQIENGRTRIPPELLKAWAGALEMPTAEFSKITLRYFDPVLYAALFEDNP